MRNKFKSNEGSFTLEASLVMPIVLMVTIMLMFFCMYIYQQSILQQVASAAVERSAYSWDNSYKETSSGAFQQGQYDSLYWRLTDDQMLSAMFGWAGTKNKQSVSLPEGDSSGALPATKLSKVSKLATGNIQGEITYQNALLLRKVSTELDQLINLPLLEQILSGGSELEASAQSIIVEPVEFIRTVELMRYYAAKFKGSEGSTTDKGNASEVLKKYGSKK